MKIIQKYLCILAFTAALFGAVVCLSPKASAPLPGFVVQHQQDSQGRSLSIVDAQDGNYYVFLPSYVSLEQVTVSQAQNQNYFLDDIPLLDGMNCASLELEVPYVFSQGQQQLGALWFYQSANVATLYMDTVSGNMKYLHQNKDHKETAAMVLYTPEGEVNFTDKNITVSGRGNATWEYDKRPYALTLSSDSSLLDMAPASKWVLLANAADETNLNNKLVLDLAKRLEFSWTPNSRWVDLYLNGEYSGLYLLVEKVEVHKNRLNLDQDSGDFLCRVDLPERWPTIRNPFLTEAGRTVEISDPQILAAGQPEEIANCVNALEAEILSGRNLQQSSILDMDSWVRKYLIDEIFANIDSDLASSYFYRSEGTIFAGPLWDYDMTLGNYPRNQDPHALIAKNAWKSDTLPSPYYSALYSNESFYLRMVELYRTEFLPELQNMLAEEIDAYIAFIEQASAANSLRWRTMYENLPADVVHTPEALKDYFSRRVQFLNSAWLEGTPYCTVQFESSPGSAYRCVSVEKGQCLESAYINTETVIWVDSETGEVFDFRQPVMSDRILSKQVQ